jgi:penicillin amidase
MSWLRAAAQSLQSGRGAPAPVNGVSRDTLAMPYQQNGPLGLPPVNAALDFVSPPLACGQGGTIWSQKGNSYTHIVDLAEIDNSRAVLPPGISEDPESPFHLDQVSLWAAGQTRPAPIHRARVEEYVVSRTILAVPPGAE